MVLKIQVEFSTPISIQGNTKNSVFVILEPYSEGETSTIIPDFANDVDAANNGFTASTNHLGQSFTNVFETNPTNMEVNGKYLKLTLDSYFDDIYKFLKNFHFFYEEQAENGKIIRGDVAASLSQSTKIAVSNSTGLVETTGANAPLAAKDQFEFEIVKILIKDEEPDKIFYFYTSNRTLTIKDSNGLVAGEYVVVSDFLDQIFTNDNEYYDTAATDATQKIFSLGNGITTGEDANGNKFFYVEKDPNGGRLTQNSTISNVSFDSQNTTYTTTDEFGLTLKIPDDTNTVLDNKIKNPTLHAEIIPSIGGQGYIAVKMSKDEGTTFLNMIGVTNDNNDSDRTIRHGAETDNDQSDHPVTGDLSVTSGNAFNDNALDFNFTDDNGDQKIQDIISGNELKVEVDEYGEHVILMRLNRFPRHGITYSINYSHQLNFASGFFGPNNHGVLAQNPISVTNDLKEVTATVGKLKVYYPSSKPGTFSDRPTGTAAATGNFDAYYYVDITFQRTGTNGDIDITAKYDVNKPPNETAFGFQADSGHKIHNGLIISKDSTTAIFEDITRTTIRDQNGNPVTLDENSFGKILRIEVPFAVGNPETGTAGAYPYNTSTSQLTSNNFADSTSPPGILLSDREEKDVGGNGTGSYYYINVMDSQGNVVKPFNVNLQTDNDWGKDKDGNTPSVASIEYKVSWDANTSVWVKELVLTHNQDLQGAGTITALSLTKDGTSIDILDTVELDSNDDSILTVGIDDDYSLLTGDVADGKIKLAYDKPGTADNLTNWLGFEIEAYTGSDAKIVTLDASNPALPSFSNLSLGAITDGTGSFSVPLTWAEIVDDDGISYEVGVSTDGGSSYTVLPDSGITVSSTSNTGATISGLSYGQAYTFRVRASTYDYGPYSSSVSLSAQTSPSGPAISGFITGSSQGNLTSTWDEPDDSGGETWYYKLEISSDNFVTTSATVIDQNRFQETTFQEGPDTTITNISITLQDTDITGGFSGNTIYYLRASAREDYENGSYGSYGTPGEASQLTVPPKVLNLDDDDDVAETTLTLKWNAIGGESFGSGEGYTVDQYNGNTWDSVNQTPTTNTTLAVSGLTPNTSYTFRVKATNATGSGVWSDSYSVSTLADTSGPLLSNFDWDYQESGSTTWIDLAQAKTLGLGDKLRLIFDATDDTGCSVDSVPYGPGATVGTVPGNMLSTYNVTGNVTDGFEVTMEYTVQSNANGAIIFKMKLTDGTYTTELDSNGTPPYTVTADTTGPTMTITAATNGVTNGSTTNVSSIVVDFTSSEATTDFLLTDITCGNGSIATLFGSGTSYSGTFSTTSDGACTIDVAEGAFTDAAGNNNTAATQFNWTYDSTSPAPAPVSAPTGLVPSTGDSVIIEFTEELFLGNDANFSTLDSSSQNTNMSGFAVNLGGQGSGGSSNQSIAKDATNPKKIIISGPTIYTDPQSSNVTVEYTQPTTEAHILRDAAGNFLANFDNATITITNDSELTVSDNTPPTMTITANEVSDGDTSNDATLSLTFTSSEATTNFASTDITVSNGSISNFSGSGTTYTATFTPTGNGACTIDVAAGTFTDAASNNNTAATQFNWTYDATGPTMTITAASSGVTNGSTTNESPILVDFTSSEATTNFAVGDITVSNGSLGVLNGSANGTSYSAYFTPTGDGACTIDVAAGTFTDAAGNNNTAATQFNWTYDGTSPTMTIASTTSGVTDGSTTNDSSIDLTFTSSEATSDFVVGDITPGNGTLSNFNATSSTVYTATFTPTIGESPQSSYACTIDVDANKFTDAAGNNNTAATQFNWTYDAT